MDVLEAREKVSNNQIIWCYNLKEHQDIQRCRVIQYPFSMNKYYPDDERFWDCRKIILKPVNSKEKEFVSNVKHIFLTEEEANKHLLNHLLDNIGIYQREIENIKKEAKRKLAPFQKHLTETRRMLKKIQKVHENNQKVHS